MNSLRKTALALAGLCGSIAPAAANEADFVFVTAMPVVEGEIVRTVTRKAPDSGITFSQTTYRHDTSAFMVSTYVVEASCADPGLVAGEAGPYIIAVKYQPKNPQAFSVAGLHDIFRDVYVRDRQNRIRVYQNMGGREMIELTDTFSPACEGI